MGFQSLLIENELKISLRLGNVVITKEGEVSHVKAYVEENYPIYKEFSQTEVMNTLRECLHSLGSVYVPSVTGMVYDKMISSSMGIYKKNEKRRYKSDSPGIVYVAGVREYVIIKK